MVEGFKWVKGINKGNIDQVLEFGGQDGTRGNGYKVKGLGFGTNMGGCWFTDGVVNDWSGLGGHVVGAESMGSFGGRLDRSMDEDGGWDG